MLPPRAGELLLGGLVAMASLRGFEPPRIPARLAAPIAIAGLLLVASSLWLLSAQSRVPGWLLIPPTLGTAAIILATLREPNVVSRALSWRPLVAIGLISYSAYLWHWPILALYRYCYGEIGLLSGLVAAGATMALAWLTYEYVEQPLRRSEAGAWQVFVRQLLLPGGALGVVVLLSMFPQRVGLPWPPASYRARIDALQRESPLWYNDARVCLGPRIDDSMMTAARCIGGADTSAEPRALLVGDSNAGHYVGMVDVLAREAGFRVRNVSSSGCPPSTGRSPAPRCSGVRTAPRRAMSCARASRPIPSSSWRRRGPGIRRDPRRSCRLSSPPCGVSPAKAIA